MKSFRIAAVCVAVGAVLVTTTWHASAQSKVTNLQNKMSKENADGQAALSRMRAATAAGDKNQARIEWDKYKKADAQMKKDGKEMVRLKGMGAQ